MISITNQRQKRMVDDWYGVTPINLTEDGSHVEIVTILRVKFLGITIFKKVTVLKSHV